MTIKLLLVATAASVSALLLTPTAGAETLDSPVDREVAFLRAPSMVVGRFAGEKERGVVKHEARSFEGALSSIDVPYARYEFCVEELIDGAIVQGCVPVLIIGPHDGPQDNELRGAFSGKQSVLLGLQPYRRSPLEGYVIVHNLVETVTDRSRLPSRGQALRAARARAAQADRRQPEPATRAPEVPPPSGEKPRPEGHPGSAAPSAPSQHKSPRNGGKPRE